VGAGQAQDEGVLHCTKLQDGRPLESSGRGDAAVRTSDFVPLSFLIGGLFGPLIRQGVCFSFGERFESSPQKKGRKARIRDADGGEVVLGPVPLDIVGGDSRGLRRKVRLVRLVDREGEKRRVGSRNGEKNDIFKNGVWR